MKRKTATIRIYPIFGCKSDAADVFYRGKLIYALEGKNMAQHLLNAAQAWAKDHGFTHTIVKFG